MSLLDSKAVFESRLKELGIEGLLAACRARRIDTYGSFAYSCDYVPGSDERTSFFELLDDLGLNRRHPQSTAVRRLFYEAVSLASEELKAKTQRRDIIGNGGYPAQSPCNPTPWPTKCPGNCFIVYVSILMPTTPTYGTNLWLSYSTNVTMRLSFGVGGNKI